MLTDLLLDDDGRPGKPVFAIREKSGDIERAPAALQATARLNGFGGDIGAVLNGDEAALVGVGDGSDPLAIAAGAERLPAGDYRLVDGADEEAAFGWALGGYRFDRYKTGKPREARLLVGADVARGARRAASATALVRDLVNTPAGDMTPDHLEAEARAVAGRFGAEFRSIVGDALLQANFPMIHAVGRAAASAPRLVDFVWGDPAHPKVTLVGKGVCFDTGGLNMKGESAMALMKKDMGGAAHVFALAQMIMEAALPVRLRVLAPLVENAVSGASFRPGDVLTSRKGLTVEIGNTDAEGRLVLADAMTLGAEDRPDVMLTLATLTGAARVALGPDLPPFYCDDAAFAADVLAAAEARRDPVWRMPLWKPYDAMLSSPIADMTNAPGGGFAGSITAALFLKRFAPESGVWGHFDIYAWRPKAAPGRPVGGEAQTLRALFETFSRR